MELAEIIIEKIRRDGPLSFRDYMELALYYPGHGYYTSAKNKIGASGDFYTSSSLTPAFGAMIGRQLEEMWRIMGEAAFAIVEYGAGSGALCHDILQYAKGNRRFYNSLHYYIIERSSAMQERERAHLGEKVTWCGSIAEIQGVTGCVLSNELLDNFPVHQVEMGDELMEVFVDYDGAFKEVLLPASEKVSAYLDDLDVLLPKGYRTEVNLDALEWLREISESLDKGYLLTVDYGYESAKFYSERHSGGTLVCYNQHAVNDHVYAHIGEQDITAHVNFSALRQWGEKDGLNCTGYTNQANFLLSLGLAPYLKKITDSEPYNLKNYRKEALIKHKLLVDMGDKFKVLIQQKGLPVQDLLGLRLEAMTVGV